MITKKWTAKQEAMMRELWGKGMTARAIADAVNAATRSTFTRNAIIGKAKRLGLSGRPSPLPAGYVQRVKPPSTGKLITVPVAGKVTIATARHDQCHFHQPDGTLCGAKVYKAGAPYCAGCTMIAYTNQKGELNAYL